MSLIIGSDVDVLDGKSLNLEMRRIDNEIMTLHRRLGKRVYSSMAALDLPETATREEIVKRMPTNTVLAVERLGGTSGATLPLPYFTGGGVKNYMSGMLMVVKNNDGNKVQFYFRNESWTAECSYNAYTTPAMSQWRFVERGVITGVYASQFANLISNIWVTGVYYFTRSEMGNFTDKPSDNGGWLTVYNTGYDENGGRHYEFRENNPGARIWKRNANNPWHSMPNLWINGRGDAEMEVGDFKIASGVLYAKKSASLVVEIK